MKFILKVSNLVSDYSTDRRLLIDAMAVYVDFAIRRALEFMVNETNDCEWIPRA